MEYVTLFAKERAALVLQQSQPGTYYKTSKER